MRIAKNGYKQKVSASTKSSSEPLKIAGSYNNPDQWLPTVGFAVDFNIPDELFSQAQQVIAEIDVTQKGAKVLAEIPVPEKKK